MANGKKRAPKSRARIIEIKAKLARKGATTAEIISALREKYPEIIRAEKDDLIYLGLVNVVNTVCNLKGGGGDDAQKDLFAGYDVPKTVTVFQNSKGGPVKKNLDALTKAEFAQYMEAHNSAPPKQSRQAQELERLFAFIKDFGGADWTVKQCWEAAQAQAKAKPANEP